MDAENIRNIERRIAEAKDELARLRQEAASADPEARERAHAALPLANGRLSRLSDALREARDRYHDETRAS